MFNLHIIYPYSVRVGCAFCMSAQSQSPFTTKHQGRDAVADPPFLWPHNHRPSLKDDPLSEHQEAHLLVLLPMA